MLLAVSCISPVYGQRTWGHTDLDTLVSVRTPFRGEEYQDEKILYFKAFFATGYANRFVMVRMDMEQMARDAPQKAKGGALVIDIDKFLHRAIAKNFLQFVHPQFTREYPVSLVTKPDLTARHRFYTGIDDVSQDKATMEVTWFSVGQVIYMFFCTTVDTTSQGGIEERQHYFSTIQLAH
jgi:hypothetical protein